jgi:hypothetical protein
MTVEAYLKSLVMGLIIDKDVLTRAAYSPMDVGLQPFWLEDEAYPNTDKGEDFQKRLDYAASTLYYSILGVFAGGGYSEQVGDVRVSHGGYTITMSDRVRYQNLADNLRRKHGFLVEGASEIGGMFDARYLRGR